MNLTEKQILELKIIDALQTCYDPEIPVNIYELGLIYGIEISDSADEGSECKPDAERKRDSAQPQERAQPSIKVRIKMTLTAPNCPVAASLPLEVETKVNAVEGVKSAQVDIVWDPPWTPGKMSEAAKLQLGMI
jgi:metal-sulfur cluster biosynthetic enzyme